MYQRCFDGLQIDVLFASINCIGQKELIYVIIDCHVQLNVFRTEINCYLATNNDTNENQVFISKKITQTNVLLM